MTGEVTGPVLDERDVRPPAAAVPDGKVIDPASNSSTPGTAPWIAWAPAVGVQMIVPPSNVLKRPRP